MITPGKLQDLVVLPEEALNVLRELEQIDSQELSSADRKLIFTVLHAGIDVAAEYQQRLRQLFQVYDELVSPYSEDWLKASISSALRLREALPIVPAFLLTLVKGLRINDQLQMLNQEQIAVKYELDASDAERLYNFIRRPTQYSVPDLKLLTALAQAMNHMPRFAPLEDMASETKRDFCKQFFQNDSIGNAVYRYLEKSNAPFQVLCIILADPLIQKSGITGIRSADIPIVVKALQNWLGGEQYG